MVWDDLQGIFPLKKSILQALLQQSLLKELNSIIMKQSRSCRQVLSNGLNHIFTLVSFSSDNVEETKLFSSKSIIYFSSSKSYPDIFFKCSQVACQLRLPFLRGRKIMIVFNIPIYGFDELKIIPGTFWMIFATKALKNGIVYPSMCQNLFHFLLQELSS